MVGIKLLYDWNLIPHYQRVMQTFYYFLFRLDTRIPRSCCSKFKLRETSSSTSSFRATEQFSRQQLFNRRLLLTWPQLIWQLPGRWQMHRPAIGQRHSWSQLLWHKLPSSNSFHRPLTGEMHF